MITHVTDRVPHRWRIPFWIITAAVAVGPLVAVITLLRNAGQDPMIWFGWFMIAAVVTQMAAAAAGRLRRHTIAARTPQVQVPAWLHHDWEELSAAVGLPVTTDIGQYAGLDAMTGSVIDDTGDAYRWWLLIHPDLIDHPRPLVRYTLAVQAVRSAAHLSTTRATLLHHASQALGWVAGLAVGIGAVTGTLTWLVPIAVVAALTSVGFAEISDTLGTDVYLTADYITQAHLGIYPTGDLAAAADASPTWRYARFEPDLDSRDLHTPTELAATSHLDATSQGPADRGGHAHRQLPTGVSAAAPWTIIQGGGER